MCASARRWSGWWRAPSSSLGGLDMMVANAGVGSGAPFLEQNDENYDRIMDTNMRGVYLCGQAAARAMVARAAAARSSTSPAPTPR